MSTITITTKYSNVSLTNSTEYLQFEQKYIKSLIYKNTKIRKRYRKKTKTIYNVSGTKAHFLYIILHNEMLKNIFENLNKRQQNKVLELCNEAKKSFNNVDDIIIIEECLNYVKGEDDE